MAKYLAALAIIPELKVRGTVYNTANGNCVGDYIDVINLVDALVKKYESGEKTFHSGLPRHRGQPTVYWGIGNPRVPTHGHSRIPTSHTKPFLMSCMRKKRRGRWPTADDTRETSSHSRQRQWKLLSSKVDGDMTNSEQ
ncbi:hypothetical protein MRB53_020691 [Persea americana]|uniref:Uncharacterized protein n=1 Tax=Persea americana TaxID=3435 RepID=A0ACC2L1N0_PERAE|nr:hypothetical protein MRB53_020691 [Persea americana]